MDLTVGTLVERFDSGGIRLPIMQRDYVWTPKKVVRLLDSLYKGWPIGSFYVWQPSETEQTIRARVGALIHRMDGFYGFLLDGQQRLTSISLSIREGEDELAQRAFFDLENEEFFLGEMNRTIEKRIARCDPLIVPLSGIVSKSGEEHFRAVDGVIQTLREHKKLDTSKEHTYRERLHRLSRMLGRKALCEEFVEKGEEDAFELFSRLNKGGTSLSTGDVEAARMASMATKKIVQPMREVAAENEMRMLGINFVFLLRCLVTVHRGNCSFSKLPKSWAEDAAEVAKSWVSTEKAVRAAVKFVREEVGWTTRRWLPSTMALIPVMYLLAKTEKGTLRGNEGEIVKQYLLISGLRSLFRGAPETAVNHFITPLSESGYSLPKLSRTLIARIAKNRLYKIRKEDVRNTVGLYQPLMQVYLAFLYENNARSWPSMRTLKDVLHDGLESDPVAVHHVFPKKYMQGYDIPIDHLNTAANYAIISQADNAELGDRDPQEAWQSLKPNQREAASQQLFFVGRDELLKKDSYDEFLEVRSEKMANKLNEFLRLGQH